MILEVIAINDQDLLDLNKTKVDRVQLCAKTEMGGQTPPFDLVAKALKYDFKVSVLIKNHNDNFMIDEPQLTKAISQIHKMKELGVKSIVFGALTKHNRIDKEALAQVVEAKGNMELTFSKAFDHVANLVSALKVLEEFNIKNVLTSGGFETSVEDNFGILQKLQDHKTNINLILGGGLTIENFRSFVDFGFENLHFGSGVRKGQSYFSKIDTDLVEQIKEHSSAFVI